MGNEVWFVAALDMVTSGSFMPSPKAGESAGVKGCKATGPGPARP